MDEKPVAIEQTERMIPLSAVLPLLGWATMEIMNHGDYGSPTPLRRVYDHAAKRVGLRDSDHILLREQHGDYVVPLVPLA